MHLIVCIAYVIFCSSSLHNYVTAAVETFGMATFGEGTGPIWLDDVTCSGLENKLLDCYSNGLGENNCDHTEDAGVRCEGMCSY